jgi:hypothetical protein
MVTLGKKMRLPLHAIVSLTGLWLALFCGPLFCRYLGLSPLSCNMPLLCLPAAAAESAPRGVALSNYKIYTVRMDTTVKAPATGLRCTDVRVWHALPTYKPWSQTTNPRGALDQHAKPAAIIEAEADNRSTHILFDAKTGQLPNVETHYTSDFRVLSPERRFDSSTCHLDWPDVLRYNSENKIRFADPSSEIAALAAKLKYNKSPIETVTEYSKWIKDNLTYDATCTFDGNDVATILSRQRGHCWHFMALMRALCSASGLQCRQVEGLNLSFPNGTSTYDQSRSDYTNGHVWSEVYFPNVGWIEVEPGAGDKCFNIPSAYIQNNTKFQNYAVWITEQGQAPRLTKWILDGSKYVNDYGVTHKITYSEVRR